MRALRWIGGLAAGLAAFALVVAGAAFLWLRTGLPRTDGTLRVDGLSGTVEIVRDGFGIPHVWASAEKDLWFALGFLHAQDRLELEPEHEIATAASLVEDDRKITGILLRVPTREGSNSSASIQSQFDRLRRDPTLTVAMPSEQVRQLFAIVANVDSLFLAIAAAVLLASAVSILLALYHSMGERRRQIALFRTLGCSGGRLVSMVLAESASLGFLGGLVGIAMALVGGSLAAGIFEARVGLVIEPGIDPRAAVITLGATVALAVLAGIVPAVRAYRTPILENLRPAG